MPTVLPFKSRVMIPDSTWRASATEKQFCELCKFATKRWSSMSVFLAHFLFNAESQIWTMGSRAPLKMVATTSGLSPLMLLARSDILPATLTTFFWTCLKNQTMCQYWLIVILDDELDGSNSLFTWQILVKRLGSTAFGYTEKPSSGWRVVKKELNLSPLLPWSSDKVRSVKACKRESNDEPVLARCHLEW